MLRLRVKKNITNNRMYKRSYLLLIYIHCFNIHVKYESIMESIYNKQCNEVLAIG